VYLYAAPLQKRLGFDFLLSTSLATGKRSISMSTEVLCVYPETISSGAFSRKDHDKYNHN